MKGKRSKSREAAMQALYQWKLSGGEASEIEAHFRQDEGYSKLDGPYFSELLRGAISDSAELTKLIEPHLDRQASELSPVEFSILLLSAYEFQKRIDVPYKVVINEAVELAKRYGGTDGYKYVNGVLDKLSKELRPEETRSRG